MQHAEIIKYASWGAFAKVVMLEEQRDRLGEGDPRRSEVQAEIDRHQAVFEFLKATEQSERTAQERVDEALGLIDGAIRQAEWAACGGAGGVPGFFETLEKLEDVLSR